LFRSVVFQRSVLAETADPLPMDIDMGGEEVFDNSIIAGEELGSPHLPADGLVAGRGFPAVEDGRPYDRFFSFESLAPYIPAINAVSQFAPALPALLVGAAYLAAPQFPAVSEFPMIAGASRTKGGGRRNEPTELPEERAARWIESKIKAFFQSKFWLKFKRLIWNPPSFEGSSFLLAKENELPKIPRLSFAMHKKGKPLTNFIVNAVGRFVRDDWKDAAEPKIIEVGAGSGALASAMVTETGAKVLEVDLFEGGASAGNRMIANMTDMNRVGTGSMKVAVSSFAFEYEGPPAAREIFRVLAPDGHFVALAHHARSAIVRTNLLTDLIDGIATFICSFGLFQIILPQALINGFATGPVLSRQLERIAFKSQEQAIDLLAGVGFVDIEVETVTEPMNSFASPRDVGWLITARKPRKR